MVLHCCVVSQYADPMTSLLPTETPEADELIRRFALWLLREALLSWVSLNPSQLCPLSWLMHVMQ